VADGVIYAHSLPGEAMDRWEWLTDHQEAVAALAAEFARSVHRSLRRSSPNADLVSESSVEK
jgi:hypothetical protein